MRSRDSVLFASVAAVAGLGAGFLIASLLQGERSAQASAPASLRPQVAQVHAAAVRSPEPDLEERGIERTSAVAPTEAAAPRLAQAELERAVGAVRTPTVEAAAGAGVITGEVLDELGAPLAGAEIVATPIQSNRAGDPDRVGGRAPEEIGLEQHLRSSADQWARTHGLARRAVSGADGRFELGGLLEQASYGVAAFLEGRVLEAEGTSQGVSPGQRVVFHAEPVLRIPVRLVLEGGGRPADGVVAVRRGNDQRLYTWSDDAPVLRLTPGRVGLRGYSGSIRTQGSRGSVDSSHASEELSLEVADGDGAPVELLLKARSGIRGRVLDADGAADANVEVRLLALGSEDDLDLEALASSERQMRPTAGRFHLLDLEPGLYAVGLTGWNEVLLAHALVDVGEGIVEVDLLVPEPDPDQHLIVRAFGPSGRALRDLDFHLTRRSSNQGTNSSNVQGRRTPDGAYWVRPRSEYFASWGPGTSYALAIRHSELGRREIELTQGQREVEVTFEEPVTLVVVVDNYAGSGHVGKLRLAVTPVDTGSSGELAQRRARFGHSGENISFSPDGVARIENLAPGRWKVDLQVETSEWQARTVRSAEVLATTGEQRVTMDLPALYELVVVAPGLAADGWLFLSNPQGADTEGGFFEGGSHAQIGAGGRTVFRGLAAGDYVLSGSGLFEPVHVTVPSAEIYLENKEPDCLRVAIGDLEGMLYKAGLRGGDLIVAVDGAAFGSVQNAYETLLGSGAIELTVLREGLSLTLPFERISAGGDWWSSLGGMLTPASRP